VEELIVRNSASRSKVYRPEIKDRSAEIVEMFVSRGYFKTQSEVVEAGLEILLERALQEDSKLHRDEASSLSSELVKAQVD
jgi:Arc/MetJ-type ribon-helix-helix transcriptional regulator